ncbi:NAD(P)-dependent dehydrogenase (short-subunit alcohol dehydrogenase family) [Rhodovulum iodosum]|uniref:NAD(P)-dependent dehydrogenase (Short-subunit alcohol dehydrogenase family) n=1 Tax=Rhodovulum iodosum TaxID=68291 RepID=A0ABV3XY76_9RHOB|nr:SDR family NAD(P)-dependent oxidoreductase [Rhodovulum robiginosum]RSK33578.1 SDR family NAD(P)-dependent oxidoreductase [Rhodovulum robiginosum]
MTDQKIALVTGASRGFGAAAAETLARAGYHVIAVARTQGGLEELDDRIKEAGGHATLAPMDISDTDAMRHLCRAIFDRWGRLDLWVHAAVQTPPFSPAEQLDLPFWQKAVTTDVYALGMLVAFVAPLLRAAPGRGTAILVDDTAEGPFLGGYAACKAAQRALFTAWEAEQARLQDVHVLRFEPAPMPTAHRHRLFPGEDRSRLAQPMDEAARMIRDCALG